MKQILMVILGAIFLFANQNIEMLEKACESGDGEKCHTLGVMYEEGNNTKKDELKAIFLYKKSCELDYGKGCNYLGNEYNNGKLIKNDYKKAIPVLERAVVLNQNYSNALYFLGLSYDKQGNKDGALAAFKRIGVLNPDNQNVKDIIVSLESGGSAFDVVGTKTTPALKTSTLPVSE